MHGVIGLARGARREGARARADADDRPLARHPRRADHRGPGVRALARRGRARVEPDRSARATRSRSARSPARSASYGNLDPEIEREALGELGLEPETVATQIVARDRHAEVLCALALLGTGDRADRARRAALAAHRGRRGRGGLRRRARRAARRCRTRRTRSSARTSPGSRGCCASYAQAGLEDVALWHERDISHSSVERVAMPDATILADFMTARATGARRRASSSTRAA